MRISDWSSDVCSSDLGRQDGSGRNCPHPRFRGDGGNYSLAHFLDIHHTPFADLEFHLLVVEVILPTLANRGAMAVLQLHDPVRLAAGLADDGAGAVRSEVHTSELKSLMRTSDAVLCLQQ